MSIFNASDVNCDIHTYLYTINSNVNNLETNFLIKNDMIHIQLP